MFTTECLRTVLLVSLVFVAWFALIGWSLFRPAGGLPRGRILQAVVSVWGGCVVLCLAGLWLSSVMNR